VTAALYTPQAEVVENVREAPTIDPDQPSGYDASVVWSGGSCLSFGRESLALDIATGQWRTAGADAHADPPTRRTRCGPDRTRWSSASPTKPSPPNRFVGYTYDPIADSWRAIAAPPEADLP